MSPTPQTFNSTQGIVEEGERAGSPGGDELVCIQAESTQGPVQLISAVARADSALAVPQLTPSDTLRHTSVPPDPLVSSPHGRDGAVQDTEFRRRRAEGDLTGGVKNSHTIHGGCQVPIPESQWDWSIRSTKLRKPSRLNP
jgi:hypothetical protein